jgi:hypothetical protein
MGGRIIRYDIVCFSLFGYWLGLLAARNNSLDPSDRHALPWYFAVAALLSTYFSAGIAKIFEPRSAWVSTEHVGVILHVAKFRHELGISPFMPPAWLIEYFSRPRFLGGVALAVVLGVELLAPVALVISGWIGFYLWEMIFLSGAMFVFTTVVFESVVGLFFALAIPWRRIMSTRPATLSLKPRLLAAGLCVVLTAFDWALPVSPMTMNSSKIWPFSRFNMFAWSNRNYTLYFLKDERGLHIPLEWLKTELHTSIVPLNTEITTKFGATVPRTEAAELICRKIMQAGPSGLIHQHRWTVWARHVRFDPIFQELKETDRPLLACGVEEPFR